MPGSVLDAISGKRRPQSNEIEIIDDEGDLSLFSSAVSKPSCSSSAVLPSAAVPLKRPAPSNLLGTPRWKTRKADKTRTRHIHSRGF